MAKIYNKDKKEIGLYAVCDWFVETYPDDIFVSQENKVNQIRNLCQEILIMRKK